MSTSDKSTHLLNTFTLVIPQLSWAACPVPDHPFSEETFPNVQFKLLLAQLEGIFSCPVTCYLSEEVNPHLTRIFFQVVVDRASASSASPQPPPG